MTSIRAFQDQVSAREEEIANLEHSIELEYLRMEDLTILSPISGTIMNYPDLWPGMNLSPTGQPIPIVIAQTRTLTLRGEVFQGDIQKIQVGMSVTVDAYVWGELTRVDGILTQIDRNATHSGDMAFFPVVISVDNSMGQIMEGTGANFSIDLDVSHNPIVVPIQAVQRVGRSDFVYLKPPDGKTPENAVELLDRDGNSIVPPGFYAIPVRCGIQSARFMEITEGLLPEWNNWEVFTHRSNTMPSPAPSFDFDPGTDDPDLLDWFDKGYQQGLEDAAKASPSPDDPYDPWSNDPGWDDGGWDDGGWDDGGRDDGGWDDDGWNDGGWDDGGWNDGGWDDGGWDDGGRDDGGWNDGDEDIDVVVPPRGR
jgi:hypothetical protein